MIIGHSERREYFHETDEDINKKAKAIFANGMTPILCCGESLETYEAGKTAEWIEGQITAGLADLSAEQVSNMLMSQSGLSVLVNQLTHKSLTKFVELYVKQLKNFMEKKYQKQFVSNTAVL